MLDAILLGTALTQAREIREQLRRAEAELQLPGAVYQARGLAKLHDAIRKLDEGIRTAEQMRV